MLPPEGLFMVAVFRLLMGEEGALPAVLVNNGVREDILSLMVELRELVVVSGSGDWGLRANTGTEEKWSRGIRI